MANYNYIGKLSEGLRRFKFGNYPLFKCGFLDSTDNQVISPIYSNVKDFNEGLASVKIGNWSTGKWGYINISGELVIDYLFDKPRKFSDGYAKVILDGEWCFINKKGVKVISLKNYDGGSSFHNGYAIVSRKNSSYYENVFGIIDKNGNEVVPCIIKCYKIRKFFSCENLENNIELYKNGYYR